MSSSNFTQRRNDMAVSVKGALQPRFGMEYGFEDVEEVGMTSVVVLQVVEEY